MILRGGKDYSVFFFSFSWTKCAMSMITGHVVGYGSMIDGKSWGDFEIRRPTFERIERRMEKWKKLYGISLC